MTLFGITPFADFSLLQIAGLAAIYALAFFIKGVFGYGAVPTLVVLGSLVVPPHHAVLLAAISNLITHVQFIPGAIRYGDRRLALRLVFFFVPTIAFGVWVFSQMDSSRLSLAAGVLILFIMLTEIFGLLRHAEPLIRKHNAIVGPLAASLAGLIAGLIGAGAMVFLSLYIKIFCPEKQQFRATILLVATMIIVWRSIILLGSHIVGPNILLEAALLSPVAFAAGSAGGLAMRAIPNALFFRLYQVLMAAGAVLLIFKGLG